MLDDPELVYNGAPFVVGNLLEVQMAGIVGLQPQIAKVLAVEGAPGRHMLKEWLASLMIAGSARYNVHRCTRIDIRLRS